MHTVDPTYSREKQTERDVAQDEKAVSEQPVGEAAAGRKGGGLIRILIIAGSLVGGSAAGALILGPMIAPAAAAEGDATDDHEKGAAPKKSKGGGHGKAEASPLYNIESLVVNPSGTQGTRFIVMSIAVETKNSQVTDDLKSRDAEVRDVLVNLVASQTIDELADLNRREALKQAIGEQLEAIAGKGSIMRVFLPQFVLQ